MKSTARISSHPIHPMLIPFPLALWITSFILDLIGAWRDSTVLHIAAYYMAIAGCVGAVLAALPGLIDLLTVIPKGTGARRTGWVHGILNVAALVLFVISIVVRPGIGMMSTLAYLTAAVAVVLLGISGWLGGTLVYDHHVGVAGTGIQDEAGTGTRGTV
jgi:uncharacterized membrane protein